MTDTIYPGVRAYVRGLYAKYRLERLLFEIGAIPTKSNRETVINPIFLKAIDKLTCNDVVESVILKTPPVFLCMLEDGIQNGEIVVETPVYEPRRYNEGQSRFLYRDDE